MPTLRRWLAPLDPLVAFNRVLTWRLSEAGTASRVPMPSEPARFGRGRRIGVLAVSSLLFLSACATGPGSQSTSSAPPNSPEAQLAARNEKFNSILLQGCGAGVVVGLVAGLLIGRDAKSAAIGGAAGGALGCAAGAGIASQNESRQEKEQSLDARINAANQAVADYQSEVGLTKRIVASEKAKIAKLRKQVAQKQASQAQMNSELAQIDENIKIIQESLKNNKERIAAVEKDVSDARNVGLSTAELEAKEKRLEALRREQQAALDSLIKERGSVG